MSEIYSYHTFSFPFIWEESEKKRSMKEFDSCFMKNPNWIKTNMASEFSMSSSADVNDDNDAYQFYADYQYFYPAVRKAIYGFSDNVVTNYSFMPDKIRNKGHYYIKNGDITYDLLLNGIKLKIFNTGIAILILECENHGKTRNGEPQNTIRAVKNINEYGRRILLPYIPRMDKHGNYSSVCADSLEIFIEGTADFKSDFDAFVREIHGKDDIEQKISLTHIADCIKNILGFGSEYIFTSRPSQNRKSFYIYPALDDRMFVTCVVCDKVYSDAVKERDKNGELTFLSAKNPSEDLYELVFIDRDGYCSCNSLEMRRRLLEEHIYTRWIDYGSLYAVANQGFVSVCDGNAYVVNPMLSQYQQIVVLCLAQRASLINFQKEASRMSAHVEERGKSIKTSTVTRLMTLQERFIAFQNQLCFFETTAQEQGNELYEMFHKYFFIQTEIELLQRQLDGLYNAANTGLDLNLNKYALIFAITALIISVIEPFTENGVLSIRIPEMLPTLLAFLGAFLIGCIGFFIYRRRK